MKPIRVLLVDDEPAIRRGLRMRLELEDDLEVVGEAPDGMRALAAITESAPDVVLMDIEMAGGDGLSATRLIDPSSSTARVIVLSIHDSEHVRGLAMRAGARAFVSKNEGGDQLVRTIRRVAWEVDTS
jgi:DNA-binding NarL/FixJ family response regulator